MRHAAPGLLWRCWQWLLGQPARAVDAHQPAPGRRATGLAAECASTFATALQVDASDAEARLHSGLYALALHPALDPEQAPDVELLAAIAQALASRDWSSRHLPRRPQLLPQLIQTVNDPEASARITATIIAQDPVLTGNLLRIANSPAFRMQERAVDSVQRAVTLVGTDGIRQIISAVLVQPVMQIDCAAFPHFSCIIWEHALLASRAAADHARAVSQSDTFAAQWMGLTQGLGAALVMKQLLETSAATGLALNYATAESALRQWTLPVAQRVADGWELPQTVHDALDDGHAEGGLGLSLRFGRAAAAASLLCRHGHIGQSHGIAWLEQVPGTPESSVRWIWRRLHGRAIETLADEQAG